MALYNGNIAWMATDLKGARNDAGQAMGVQAMAYRYDQLNRLKEARSHTASPEGWVRKAYSYDVSYDYDADGNILGLRRRNGLGQEMDWLVYQYQSGTNRLLGVADWAGAAAKPALERQPASTELWRWKLGSASLANTDVEGADFRSQQVSASGGYIAPKGASPASDNYAYDRIGNLIQDRSEGITSIQWTISGKVRRVKKSDGTSVLYRYDAMGNRISKEVKDGAGSNLSAVRYVRDASGPSHGAMRWRRSMRAPASPCATSSLSTAVAVWAWR
jgi:uncharacterized protein RhaS with RHS repeats